LALLLAFPAAALALLLAFPTAALAVPFAETGAPPELERWSNWVLYGEEHYRCPMGPDGYSPSYCVLPVTLSLDLSDSGGTFKGVWTVRGGRRNVKLPGDAKSWPGEVIEGSGLFSDRISVGNDGGPAAVLDEGTHDISGSWRWTQLPETVTVPLGPFPSVTVNGKPLEFPETDMDWNSGTARIWLKDPAAPPPPAGEEAPPAGREGDFIDVRVARLVRDDQPLSVTTRARITVSGEPREELVPGLLLPGGRPVSLRSPLPARLTSEGLRIQVRPGSYDVFIESRQTGEGARAAAPGDSPAPSAESSPAPGGGAPPSSVGGTEVLGPVSGIFGQEYWAFQSDPILRQAEVEGAVQIDASQADIPWTGLPVYAVGEGESLTVTTLRRGDPDPGPNLLHLSRECWLDYGGGALTCRDLLQGQMRRDWRLTADPPFEIGQATLNGEPQVITWQKNSKGEDAPGLQLRRGMVDLQADLRINDFSGDFPAAGWDQALSTGNAVVNLPPGWKLVNVSGADASGGDRLPAAWRDRWTTLDLFIVLVIVFATWRLLGLPWAALGAATLAVSYQEYLCPRLVYLHILAASAILKVLPAKGKARFVVFSWRALSSVFLVVTCASFVILQARWAAYPQLEPSSFGSASDWALGPSAPLYRYGRAPVFAASQQPRAYDMAADAYEPDSPQALYAPSQDDEQTLHEDKAEPSVRSRMSGAVAAAPRPYPAPPVSQRQQTLKLSSQNSMQSIVTDAKAQNSFPRPSWTWRTVTLDYNGQAAKDQTTGLTLTGPKTNRVLGALRLLLSVWFSLCVLGLRLPSGAPPRLAALFPPPKAPESPKCPDGPGGPGGSAGPEGSGGSGNPEGSGGSEGKKASENPGGGKGPGGGKSEGLPKPASGAAPALALVLALALAASALSACFASQAFAQSDSPFPSERMLEILEQRLKERPATPPPSVPDLEIRPGDGVLSMEFQVEAPREGFVSLPQLDPKIFQPAKASVNGSDAPLLAKDGEHLLLVPQGAARILFEGRLSDAATFQISFAGGSRPMRASLSGTGWDLRGVDPRGQLTGSAVFLSRSAASPGSGVPEGPVPEGPDGSSPNSPARDGGEAPSAGSGQDSPEGASPDGSAAGAGEGTGEAASGGQDGGEAAGRPGGREEPPSGPSPSGNAPAASAPSMIKPFFKLTRTVSLGQELKVLTSVEPLAELEAPFTLAVPLLAGETPMASGLSVEDGTAHLTLSPGSTTRSWESALRLPDDGSLALEAADGPWSEVWILDAATLWRVEAEGIPPVLSISDSGYWNPEWRPAPGDSLKLSVSRPKPVEGQYLVTDRAGLSVQVGKEITRAKLSLSIRSSQGGNHSFRLPAGAVTEELTLNSRPLPFGRPDADGGGPTVTAPLNPGNHLLEVEFTIPSKAGLISSSPRIDLGMPSANIDTRLNLPPERWTLLVGGPVQGPAVLFWSHAGAFLVFAFFLSSLKLTPLKTVSWLLFFLGISQLSVTASFVCAGWLLALGLRSGKFGDVKKPWRFNGLQLLLVLWTAVALYLIYRGLTHGLLESPNMSVDGNMSSEHGLMWFQDRASGPFERAWAITLPGAMYRVLMLAWALWMAVSVVRWLRWGWKAFSLTALWKRSPRRPRGARMTPAQRMAMGRNMGYPPVPGYPQGPWQGAAWPQGPPPQMEPGSPPVPLGPPGPQGPLGPQGQPGPADPSGETGPPGPDGRPRPRGPEAGGGAAPGSGEPGSGGPEGGEPEKP
jgi:hypothetical protein